MSETHAPWYNPTLAAKLQAHPDGVLEAVADEHSVPLLDVVRHLPTSAWTQIEGKHFEVVLTDMATWGEVLTLIHTHDVILEFAGPFPQGKVGHGFYNLLGGTGLKGHLRPERCGNIVFLRRRFVGLDTASVLFFNLEGGCMFKIFVRREAPRTLNAEQIARFEALAARLAPDASPDAPFASGRA